MTRSIPAPAVPTAAVPRGRTPRWWLAMGPFALLAASCGGSSEPAGNAGTSGAGVPAAGPEAPVTIAAQGRPKPGGKVRYALEAEADGFSPTKSRMAIAGIDMGMAVYDSLAAFDKDGQPQPFLAEKWESTPDFKTWTITIRQGIKFHNGQPLNADAVTGTYKAHLASGLTGAAIVNVQAVESVGDFAVKFTMKEPWATFPNMLAGQVGMIPAPEQLAMENAGPQNPIGTGPFKLKSRTIDKETVFVRNPDYWQKDADGVQLPYLEEVTFQPTPDESQRLAGLRSGQFQLMHTSNGATILQLRDLATKGEYQKVEDQGESEEGFVLLNLTKAPFDDLRVRKALALGFDREQYIASVGDGVNKPADSVFDENSPWYVKVDYPSFDPVAAKALVDEYEREKGPIKFRLAAGQASGPNIEYLARAWTEIGMEVQTELKEQTTFIIGAIAGNFEANLWRQWGEVDPDQDYHWWISDNAKPVNETALNFGRYKDPKVDEALRKARSTTDIATRKAAYKVVQEQFAANLPYIWTDHSTWVIGAANNVRGITNGALPSGHEAMPIGGTTYPGAHRLTHTWLAG